MFMSFKWFREWQDRAGAPPGHKEKDGRIDWGIKEKHSVWMQQMQGLGPQDAEERNKFSKNPKD